MTLQQKEDVHRGPDGASDDKLVPNGKDEHKILNQRETFSSRVDEIFRRPRRGPVLHWAAFVLSLVSLVPPIFWIQGSRQVSSPFWVWFDIGISLFFVVEFFTRSGFRWNPVEYSRSRFFDFIATVPVWVLIYYGVAFEGVWVWLIFVARIARAIDRLLGDGFVRRNILAVVEGFEEELTDRVMIRIIDRVHEDLNQGNFANVVGDALLRNKTAVLERIKSNHPKTGVGVGIAHLVGLDTALERAEERTYDAVIDILKSPEFEKTIHESIDSLFSVLRAELGTKSWRKHLGFRNRNNGDEK